jgi:hypothetical protein
MDQIKVSLEQKDMPRKWYNLAADLPTKPLPPLGPDGKPVSPEALAKVFPMNLLEQEMSPQRWITIPDEILDIMYRWRPSPLRRAVYLEKALKTPAKIFYKDESVSPPGSHKPNTAVPQAWYKFYTSIPPIILPDYHVEVDALWYILFFGLACMVHGFSRGRYLNTVFGILAGGCFIFFGFNIATSLSFVRVTDSNVVSYALTSELPNAAGHSAVGAYFALSGMLMILVSILLAVFGDSQQNAGDLTSKCSENAGDFR